MLYSSINSFNPSSTGGGIARQATQARQAQQVRGYASPFRPAPYRPAVTAPAVLPPQRPAVITAPKLSLPASYGTPGMTPAPGSFTPKTETPKPAPRFSLGHAFNAFRFNSFTLGLNVPRKAPAPAPAPGKAPAPAPAPAPAAGPVKEKHESKIIQREIDKRDALKEKRDQLRKDLRQKSNEAQRERFRNGESPELDREVRKLERELAKTARDYYRARAEVEKLKRMYENPDRYRFQPRSRFGFPAPRIAPGLR